MERVFSGLMLILLVSTSVLSFNIHTVKAVTITVPDDYPTIQEAINNANSGDTIFVRNGTYYENVVVNKPLNLKGESRENTLIDWEGAESTIEVIADNVSISNFRVKRSPNMSIGNSCVWFNTASGSRLTDCVVQYGWLGVFILESNSSLAANLTIQGSGLGLGAINSSHSVFRDNEISDTAGPGLVLSGSTGCLLRNNHMINCSSSFAAGGSMVDHFFNDIDTSNTIDGKHVYYLVNQTGLTVNPSTFPDAGSLTIANSTGVIVENLTLLHAGVGVAFAYTNDSLIRNVAVSNDTAGVGIYVGAGINNTVSGCSVSGCWSGVTLSSAINNTVRDNAITNSDYFGIYLWNASLNTIIGNDVLNSEWTCVYMEGSQNNTFHHNNFVNYSEARVSGHANAWDDGYPSGGNYWSGFNPPDMYLGLLQNETGSDGIGDNPYIINANNADRYPLVFPYGYVPTPDLNGDGVIDVLDFGKIALAYGSVPGLHIWNPYIDLNQDSIIDIFDLVIIAINFGKEWVSP
jgi:parallel beta-helix repeat protein